MQLIRITTFLILLAFFSYTAFAQSEQINVYISASSKAPFPEWVTILETADSFAAAAKDTLGRAIVNEKLGINFYKRDPRKAITFLQKACTYYRQAKNEKKAALCVQNIAFEYDEQLHNYDSALIFTEVAIKARTALRDTNQLANMYKYSAYLLGKKHIFAKGIQNGLKAIELYKSQKYQPGVAVSYRDMASLYIEMHKYDSAIAYLLPAKNIWASDEKLSAVDTMRIFDINNMLINSFTIKNNSTSADSVIRENESMIFCDRVPTEMKKVFFKNSGDYYNKQHNKQRTEEFREKYKGVKDQ